MLTALFLTLAAAIVVVAGLAFFRHQQRLMANTQKSPGVTVNKPDGDFDEFLAFSLTTVRTVFARTDFMAALNKADMTSNKVWELVTDLENIIKKKLEPVEYHQNQLVNPTINYHWREKIKSFPPDSPLRACLAKINLYWRAKYMRAKEQGGELFQRTATSHTP
jgi:hypothetical protein